MPVLNFGICSLAELDKIAYFDISCYDSHRWKLNTASYKILLMGKSHIYTNIFLVSPNCRSCYMEASSQIQNLLCLLLLHLCSSFFSLSDFEASVRSRNHRQKRRKLFDRSNSQRTKNQRNYGSFSAETSRVYRTGNQKFWHRNLVCVSGMGS